MKDLANKINNDWKEIKNETISFYAGMLGGSIDFEDSEMVETLKLLQKMLKFTDDVMDLYTEEAFVLDEMDEKLNKVLTLLEKKNN